ncbi:hypothetical protein BKA62DRAFT_826951 [Auriculariales sp. MPI-PUGE-AT-0066]|nr:hypothetical protein BKA62DRAFT_826951 [Auriculariales sp. MPI-PUGE-AT-0066]
MRRTLSIATNGGNTLRGPPSPTYSQTTNASVLHLGQAGPTSPQRVITRGDLRASSQAYAELLNAAGSFRNALSTLSKASAAFAHATERCARLKGASDDAASGMQSSSGLFFVLGNHLDVLNASVNEKFDKPLRQHIEQYRVKVEERSTSYERALHEKSRQIRQTETENMYQGRKRQRDLQSFRAALAKLQSQVDELDRMKVEHYSAVLQHEEENWDTVLKHVSAVVKVELDIFDRLASKSTDPQLEPILHATPDPFESYAAKSEDKIYSILPPLGMLSNASSSGSLRESSPFFDKPAIDPSLSDSVQSWRGDIADTTSSVGEPWPESQTPQSASPPGTLRKSEASKLRASLANSSSLPDPPTTPRIEHVNVAAASTKPTSNGGTAN